MICKVLQRPFFTDIVNVSIPFLTVCRYNPEGSISGGRLGEVAHRLVLQTINAQPDNTDINSGPALCPSDTVFQNQRGSEKVPSFQGDGLTWITSQIQNTLEKEESPQSRKTWKKKKNKKWLQNQIPSKKKKGPQSQIPSKKKKGPQIQTPINAQPDNTNIILDSSATVFQNQRESEKIPSVQGNGLTLITPQIQNTSEKEKIPQSQNTCEKKKNNKWPQNQTLSKKKKDPQIEIPWKKKIKINPQQSSKQQRRERHEREVAAAIKRKEDKKAKRARRLERYSRQQLRK